MKDIDDEEQTVVSICKFVTTQSGTLVYDNHGNKVGFYETDDAAAEMVREQEKDVEEGGVDDAI